MKKLLIAITLFTGVFSANAQTIESTENFDDNTTVHKFDTEPIEDFDANTPAYKFEKETIDYGTIDKDADGNRVFKFTNTGGSPLIITAAKGSCGCTVPTYDKEPIMPGETGEIKVKYATNRIGRFSKTVTLTSNASEPKKVLRIKGEVLAPKG